MANRLDDAVILEKTQGVLIWQDNFQVDFLYVFFTDVDPNGVITAPAGSLASGPLGLFMNFDGMTGWTLTNPASGSTTTIDVSGGNADIPASAAFVKVEAEGGEWLMFLPPLASVPDGKSIVFRSISGFLDAIINPDNIGEGINGLTGPVDGIYVLQPGTYVTMRADPAASTWWTFAGTASDEST
jgi:hypothetical protein